MDIFRVEVFRLDAAFEGEDRRDPALEGLQSFSDERETYVCASMEAVHRQLDQAAKECACNV